MTTEEKVIAWHFVKDDGHLAHDMDHVKVEAGLELEVDEDKLELCTYGLHASIKPLDALKYAPGATVCRVELSGRILHGDDKVVASKRKVLAMADATRTLHEFAIWCAEQALELIDDPDPRSIEALRVKRLWLDGEATDNELYVAWAWAWAAASAAAARDAAWDAQNAKLESMLDDLFVEVK